MATCLDVSGAKYPSTRKGQAVIPVEGKSLRPAFAGGKVEGREAIYWEHEGNRAIRQGDWKLVSRHPKGWELYDLRADRTEMNDLLEKDPARVERMKVAYERWAVRAHVEPWEKVQAAPRTPAPVPGEDKTK